jgi:type I restriction enzyme R subunit
MIRHAATGEPLLTAETRVDRALEKVKAGKKFTEEQEGWLRLIRYHLIQNLIMEKDDFNLFPIFQREGVNYPKLNKIFDNKLNELVSEINEAILK